MRWISQPNTRTLYLESQAEVSPVNSEPPGTTGVLVVIPSAPRKSSAKALATHPDMIPDRLVEK